MTIPKAISRFLVLLLLICFPIQAAFAQGSVRGAVTDSTTNDPIIGAIAHLSGTAFGGSTDFDGKYKIDRVPAGAYVLRISCVGYKEKNLNITVEDNQVLTINLALFPDIIQGNEVIITAQARGQMAAINQQLAASTIVNVVSEEKIKELPDANAAEAIGRLPGVSLLRSGGEANKVILRGLSDRFTNITIDGVKIPPTDEDSRGVDLSTLSQGSLAGIELFKAQTADKDGDAIAGTVNLVTKRASSEPVIRVDAKGDYNALMNSYNQYDFSGRFERRFFDELLGVQITGNLEKRIRSNERINIDYAYSLSAKPHDYAISDFTLEFTDEIRKRDGVGLILDFNTFDSGSVKLSTSYNRTNRDFIWFTRNYPTPAFGSNLKVTYQTRDREQDINTFSSALKGENYLFGFMFNWGASFAQSVGEYPYDYYVNFNETSNRTDTVADAGMNNPPNIKDRPERLLSYAFNNFAKAGLDTGIYRNQKNLDKEKTLFLDVSTKYSIGDLFSGEIKLGGKYKMKNRFKESGRTVCPYYLGYWQDYTRAADGSIVKKDFTGTWYAPFYQRFLQYNNRIPSAADFLDASVKYRDLSDLYTLKPMVNRDALRKWYGLNENGISSDGRTIEYSNDRANMLDYYDIVERISAGYVMNTLNVAQLFTVIAGLRIESENNDYGSRYTPQSLGGFPTPPGFPIQDTSSTFSEAIWLPNFHVTMRPLDFLNVRLAAYRALARPDYNARLEKFFASGSGATNTLIVSNSSLKSATAWNYEVNSSIFSNTIGLVSVSAYYKEITNMIHFLNRVPSSSGNKLLNDLGIKWRSPFGASGFQLTAPYNSSKPTKVWGFEIEHQANLNFLPGYLQFIVLSYNASLVRSETYIATATVDTFITWRDDPEFGKIKNEVYVPRLVDRKQRMESQPEVFGNVSLGYDFKDFSARISLFYQGDYNTAFSADGRSDRVNDDFTRIDLTLKQKVTENISVLLNVSNLTNIEETKSIANRLDDWYLLDTSERYGTTVDVGVRVDL